MEKDKSIQSLRGIACLLVIISHWVVYSASYGKYVNGIGKIGVWCFMILSGYFLMKKQLDNKNNKFNIFKFYGKKLLRIYPSYVVALLLWLFVGNFDKTSFFNHLILNEGMCHFWFMPVIIKMYLIWPIFVLFKKIIKNNKIYVGLLCLIGLISLFFFPYTSYIENSISITWYLPIFIMGMLVAFIPNKISKYSKWLDIIAVLATIIIIMFTPIIKEGIFNIPYTLTYYSGWLQNKYVFISPLLVAIIVATLYGSFIKKVLNKTKILQFIGNISYSLYLFHFMFLSIVRNYISSFALGTVVFFIICIIISFVWEYLLQFIINLFSNKRTKKN